jgi:hypothetical protein
MRGISDFTNSDATIALGTGALGEAGDAEAR